jgi:formate dehydrogenase
LIFDIFHLLVRDGGWNIADCAQRSYDVEGLNIGTVAAGRIGLAVLRRMHPFDVKLHYYDRHRLPKEVCDRCIEWFLVLIGRLRRSST